MSENMNSWQNRIEDKLDRLSEAVVGLARMEERMINLFGRMDKYETEHYELKKKVTDLQKTSTKRGTVLDISSRVFWIVLASAVTTAFWIIRSV